MILTDAASVVLDVAFADMAHDDRFVRDVRQDAAITPNIVRGRIAPRGVRMQLELRGAPRKIRELVGRWKDSIVAA